MNTVIRKCGWLIVWYAISTVLVGCVTTTTGGNEKRIDKEKAFDTRIQLTLSYIRQGNRDQARNNLNKAKELDATDVRIHNAAALLFQLEGESERAEQEFRAAIKKDPGYSSAHNNFGVFLRSRERHEEALEQFEAAGGDVNYDRRDAALINLGQTALALGLRDKAKASFEHALRLNPSAIDALTELAEIEFNDRNYAQAKAYLDRVGRVARPTAQSLWLGIRLERIFGNQDQEASLALALKNLYPYSNEYLEYKRLLDD